VIHPKAFRLTLFRGYRQNEMEILPDWFIYRKEEISLVKAVANKKGFRTLYLQFIILRLLDLFATP